MSQNKEEIIVETVDQEVSTHSSKASLHSRTLKYCKDRAKRHLSNKLSTRLLCKMSGQPTFVKRSALNKHKRTPIGQTKAKQSIPKQVTPDTGDTKTASKLESSQSRRSTHTERDNTEHSRSDHTKNEDNSIRSNLSDTVMHMPLCKDYKNYYAHLYGHFGNTPYLTSQVKFLLEEAITIREKQDVLHFLKYNTPLYWKL